MESVLIKRQVEGITFDDKSRSVFHFLPFALPSVLWAKSSQKDKAVSMCVGMKRFMGDLHCRDKMFDDLVNLDGIVKLHQGFLNNVSQTICALLSSDY
jgi:hypothetical protein